MRSRFLSFSDGVTTAGKSLGLIDSRWPIIGANIVVAVLAALLAIAGLDAQGAGNALKFAPGPVIALVIVAVQIAFSRVLRRRTKKGSSDYKAWMAFKHFLKDFSQVKEWRPTAVPMWEKYLVYAVPLGVADEVGKAIELHAPAELKQSGFGWYAFTLNGGVGSFGDSMGSFTHAFTASAGAAFGAASSGAGFGGGFSGGGGFGGGGGGGGGGGAS